MLRQYVPVRHRNAPQHQPGEVVLITFGNYLEKGAACSPKVRPAILLQVSDCQHLMAGLTTQATCKTTGAARPELHDALAIGLDGRRASYLWSPRPSYVCRMDVCQHLGWIDRRTVEFLVHHLRLDQFTLASLWQTTARRPSSTTGGTSCHDKFQNDITPSHDIDVDLRPRQPR